MYDGVCVGGGGGEGGGEGGVREHRCFHVRVISLRGVSIFFGEVFLRLFQKECRYMQMSCIYAKPCRHLKIFFIYFICPHPVWHQ